jgi:hypothetical protein
MSSSSTHVLESHASEALAFVALATVLARANDDVIAVDRAPAWLDVACGVVRVRSRLARRDDLFEAIGEHTRALLVLDPDDELLEALVELGPAVVAITSARSAAHGAIVVERTAGGTRVHLAPELAAPVLRTLDTLLGQASTLAA